MFLRKSHRSRLNVFAPISDLSILSKSGLDNRVLVPGKKNDVAIAGGQILGDEYSNHVVRVRLIRFSDGLHLLILSGRIAVELSYEKGDYLALY
jgi:ribosomal protein L18E